MDEENQTIAANTEHITRAQEGGNVETAESSTGENLLITVEWSVVVLNILTITLLC